LLQSTIIATTFIECFRDPLGQFDLAEKRDKIIISGSVLFGLTKSPFGILLTYQTSNNQEFSDTITERGKVGTVRPT
jgi:hypothetical protein